MSGRVTTDRVTALRAAPSRHGSVLLDAPLLRALCDDLLDARADAVLTMHVATATAQERAELTYWEAEAAALRTALADADLILEERERQLTTALDMLDEVKKKLASSIIVNINTTVEGDKHE